MLFARYFLDTEDQTGASYCN